MLELEARRETRSVKPVPWAVTPPWVMLGPVAVLLVAAGLSGFLSPILPRIEAAAIRFTDAHGYQSLVLDAPASTPIVIEEIPAPPHSGLIATLAIAAFACVIALVSLFGDRLPGSWHRAAALLNLRLVGPIRTIHSGKVGDYITWLTVGVAAFGLIMAMLTGAPAAPLTRPGSRRSRASKRIEPVGRQGPMVQGQEPGIELVDPFPRCRCNVCLRQATTPDQGTDQSVRVDTGLAERRELERAVALGQPAAVGRDGQRDVTENRRLGPRAR